MPKDHGIIGLNDSKKLSPKKRLVLYKEINIKSISIGMGLEDVHSIDKVNIRKLIFGRKSIAGSLIGGISETQEMLNFCSEHNIVPEVEIIDIKKINVAYERMLTADVKYRFVIDMKSLI